MFEREKLSHIVAVAFLLIAVSVIAVAEYFGVPVHKTFKDRQVFCTQEAKVCPDGSAVGRVGPNCEFVECATSNVKQAEDIIFGQEAEKLCGPQPPTTCQSGKQLGCDLEIKQWGCYPAPSLSTADWQTYRNEEYGFEVKYPAEWTAPTANSYRFYEKTEEVLFVNEGCGGHGLPHSEGYSLINSTESIMLDGKPAEKVIFRDRDNSVLYMSWQIGDPKESSACLELVAHPSNVNQVEILEKVFSTFKFIE